MRQFTIVGAVLVAAIVSPTDSRGQVPVAVRQAASGIKRADLERQIGVLAADSMLGRLTPSPELDQAATYIAHALSTSRVRPFGDGGSYLQHVRFDVIRADSRCSFAALDGARFAMPNDVRLPTRGASSTDPVAAQGPLVYVQHGWVNKALGIDPYAGLDLRGKIAVVTGYPGGPQRLQADRARGGQFVLPWNAAAERGAVAQVEISGFATWQVTPDRPRNRQGSDVTVKAEWIQQATPSPLPRVAVSSRLADAIFTGERWSAMELIAAATRGDSIASFALGPARELRFEVCRPARTDSTQNVVAMVEGSDPLLKHEYIVMGAHYDGQGLQFPPVNGDSVLNSANDNASGAVGLMAIARAFASGPRPRRSIIFTWFAGEETQISGADFFVARPPVPLRSIKVMVNLDMIGPDKDGTVGLGFSNTALRDLALTTNKAYASVAFVGPVDGRLKGGSDRDAFEGKQIPYLAFEADGGDDKHAVTDDVSRIDYAGFERIVRSVYVIAWRVANEQVLRVR
ncbi:M28 family peptidase [Gemmatimonas groenlandica]|uniref:M28 family peptidase n=1 Tax=Gemmatimonas groenlandica TaxID=2732249 RepID=A0A6M4IQY9_9BACT|nr:M28 family peptidase [Gemmatimonas groenlandica]QJR37153.1 M28 family peptidase [Gemmatimonas groenlandica]